MVFNSEFPHLPEWLPLSDAERQDVVNDELELTPLGDPSPTPPVLPDPLASFDGGAQSSQ